MANRVYNPELIRLLPLFAIIEDPFFEATAPIRLLAGMHAVRTYQDPTAIGTGGFLVEYARKEKGAPTKQRILGPRKIHQFNLNYGHVVRTKF